MKIKFKIHSLGAFYFRFEKISTNCTDFQTLVLTVMSNIQTYLNTIIYLRSCPAVIVTTVVIFACQIMQLPYANQYHKKWQPALKDMSTRCIHWEWSNILMTVFII